MDRSFCFIAVALTGLAGCSAADQLVFDRAKPGLAWGSAAPGTEVVQRLPQASPQLLGDPDSRFRIMVRADDDVAVASLRLSVEGRFRCATASGDWIAPFDVVREIPIAEGERSEDSRLVYAGTRLQLLGTSCGRFRVPVGGREEELYAVGGSFSLRAIATDTAGKSSESIMTIHTGPAPQAVAAL
jgi:hypothetical protein